MVTFVGTSNTMVDTTTGRIQTKGIQHNSNVITDVSGPHGRGVATLKKYPEMIFEDEKVDRNDTTNTYTQAGYTISTDSVYGDRQVYKAFSTKGGELTTTAHIWSSEDVGGNGYVLATGDPISGVTFQDENGTSYTGHYIKLELPKKIKLNSISFKSQKSTYNSTNNDKRPTSGTFLGSNDGTNWVLLKTFNEGQLSWSGGLVPGATTEYLYSTTLNNIVSDGYFSYILFVIETIGNNNEYGPTEVRDLKYYGYEEDPPAGDHSVDTTFKSRFNNPQTTGVQVLVDGATGLGTNQISGGPDPSGNQSTYVTDGKYWTLNGTLTSNLAVEANTFLEGDQPHAVSVWFNSSNLEANVSNTCVFSIASEEKLDSVNLKLQSNTWHNLTYAYQGEGGSRVTYLDGRKVAEDQAEDTFGEYPPFAMTGYSQGGYVVSSNFENTTEARKPYNAFNAVGTGNRWQVDSGYSTSSPFLAVALNGSLPSFTDTNGTAHAGHWLKLELPHKLRLNRFKTTHFVHPQYHLKSYVILGSNDDVNWTLLHSEDDANLAAGASNGTHDTGISGVTESFKYLKLLVKSKANGSSATLMVEQAIFYGHRENDLVRLPDPTNVLKYPHIAMTGPAQRGYVASASSFYNSGTEPEHGFDGVLTSTGLDHTWESGPRTGSGSGRYTAGSTFNTSYLNEVPPLGEGGFQTTESSNTWTGEWLQIELPHSINTTKYVFGNADGNSQWNDRIPTSGVILGSTNGSTWNLVHQFSSTLKDQTLTISHTGYYKYFRLVGITVGGTQTIMLIPEWELYGTEEASQVPIQIGGGNIDKVANFRVYDKFIGEDQALEIWNAQKDEFGRAKPQMVLQQGKLGIGTDAPQGSLSVADEPHNLEEFPPRGMTGYKTYFEGHGEFCASVSSSESNNRIGWRAFDKLRHPEPAGWGSNGGYTWNTGVYTGSAQLYSSGPLGEWIRLESPYGITVSHIIIDIFQVGNRGPQGIQIVGSNNGVDWYVLVDNESPTYTGWPSYESGSARVNVNSTTAYKYHAMIARSKTFGKPGNDSGNNQLLIRHLKFFGTREQGQSVLHDGQLTLTKNLTVPRIGPALDADDTPRRDRLVVEYNTSTNPTFEGAVRDTSGRGNDGVFYGGASYDATDKALVFDGTDDNLKNTLNNSEMRTLSISGWIKNADSNTLLELDGGAATSKHVKINVVSGSAPGTGLFIALADGTYMFANNSLTPDTWNHFVFVLNNGPAGSALSSINHQLYINGVIEFGRGGNAFNGGATANDTTVIDPNATLCIGSTEAGSGYHDGSISNFKLYDVALTAEEVKTLYDMGRTGSVTNPQPLHISGPVNVMGDIRYITSRPLALPTMWDHMANGNCAKGVYPIVGRNGGDTIYHVYCEPDWAGGGWMCMAQFAKNGYQVKGHPTNGDLDIFTKGLGDSKNIRWNNTFAVPLNILSLDGNGYDLDVMIVALGGGYAGRYEGGMRVGSIWRGHQLSVAFNPGTSSYPGASGLASSSDGYSFTTRTPVTNQNYDMINSGGWFYSCAANFNYNGSYNDQGLSDGGYILHQGNTNNVGSIYGAYHSDTGVAYNSQGNSEFACVRIFVRPSVY